MSEENNAPRRVIVRGPAPLPPLKTDPKEWPFTPEKPLVLSRSKILATVAEAGANHEELAGVEELFAGMQKRARYGLPLKDWYSKYLPTVYAKYQGPVFSAKCSIICGHLIFPILELSQGSIFITAVVWNKLEKRPGGEFEDIAYARLGFEDGPLGTADDYYMAWLNGHIDMLQDMWAHKAIVIGY